MGNIMSKIKDWMGKNDKTLHVWAGMIISITTALLLFYFTEIHMGYIYLIGLSMGILAGAFKEWIWDKALKLGVFSYQDFYFTIWGSVCGTVISIMVTQWMLSREIKDNIVALLTYST
jgi:hypothetical protein